MTTPETTSAPLIITLFGPLQILIDGHPLPRLRSRKGLWLLALLTLRHGRPVEREWLAGTLWPDMEQSQAFANLRPILSELRSGLGSQHERLKSPERQTLLLDLTGAEVDVLAFDAALKRGTLSDLEQATALYRGHLLEGCTEEWVFQERSVREHQCMQALQTLANSALTAGEYEKAVGYFQRAAVLDPWLDSARRGWMEALAKSGDRNAALQVYREFVEVLRDDPNASPDAQTTALYVRLRAEARTHNPTHAVVVAEPVGVPKVSGYLPHPMTDLIGREDERGEVASRLRRSRLVTLTGLGGIGKTRLALDVAREVSREYADGVWLVALDALTEGKQVTPQIASVLGLKEEGRHSLLESVTEYLRTKRLLLVLDNCEHLLEASAQIAGHLLRECGELRILATSREALEITGETVWAVPSLPTPDPAHLPQGQATLQRVLMSYESVQLFVERAQVVQKNFELTATNSRYLAEVCYRLEGIPLAIELAAARIKAMTVEQIAARLDNELSLLTGGSRIAQSRQQTLRAMLDWSYALLNAAEQRMLCRLSVFAGGWTLEAAEGIVVGGIIEEQGVLALLTSLVDKSLVAFEERVELGGGRYRLLEIVRQYAKERLLASREEEAVKAKHRDWYVSFAESVEPQLRGTEAQKGIRCLEADHDNLRAALTWCETKDVGAERHLRLAGALWHFWAVHGHYREGRRYLSRALERGDAQFRTAVRAKALSGAGGLAYRQGDYVAAQSLYQECLSICKELNEQQGTAQALDRLGAVLGQLGNYPEARSLYEESLSLHRELGNKNGIADVLNNLGNIAYRQSDYISARTLYEESLSIRRDLGDKLSIGSSLVNLGLVTSAQSDYVAAWSLFEESLVLSRESGYQQGMSYSLNNLANVAFIRGDMIMARSLFEESLSIRRNLGDMRGIAELLSNLGTVALYQDELAVTHAYYEESLNIYKELGNKRGIAQTLCNMGQLASEQDDSVAARSLYEESLSIHQELGDKNGIAWALAGLGNVAWNQSDYSLARALYRESLLLFRNLGDLQQMAEIMKALGSMMLATSQLHHAARLWGSASMMRASINAPLGPKDLKKHEQQLAQTRLALGEAKFTVAWEKGYSLNMEQAVDFALTAEVLGPFDVITN